MSLTYENLHEEVQEQVEKMPTPLFLMSIEHDNWTLRQRIYWNLDHIKNTSDLENRLVTINIERGGIKEDPVYKLLKYSLDLWKACPGPYTPDESEPMKRLLNRTMTQKEYDKLRVKALECDFF